MFGSRNGTEAKLKKLMKKKAWKKIQEKYLQSDEETQLMLAKTCGTFDCDDSRNVLLALLELPNENIKIAALDSLSVVGNDHVTSTLRLMLSKLSSESKELRERTIKTLQDIRENEAHREE